MTFNLFGPPTKDDIRVGYIDPDLGLVEGVTICQANEYAIKNPGTTFVFRNGNNVIQYLNINEVNNINPNILTSTDKCGGINQRKECGPPLIQFFGGGGVGASGNPVIGRDGSLLAIDIVRGGNGYQYPPLVAARDNCNYGTGATLTAVLGEVTETIETYENESDFEDYELCEPTDVGYGRRYGPNGEDLGPWEPRLYTDPGEDPIRKEVEEFGRIVRKLARKPFFSTRANKPTKIICDDPKIIPQKYEVTDKRHLDLRRSRGEKNPVAWNEFMNTYAISPVSPSNVRGSDFAGKVFTFEWTEEFPTDGEYIFRGLCDNKAELYVDGSKISDLGKFNGSVKPIQRTFKKGIYNIRVDLVNVTNTKPQQQATTQTNTVDVNFNIRTVQSSTFSSVFKISELGINISKPPKTLINQTIPKKVQVGKVYTIEVEVPQSSGITLGIKGNTLEVEDLRSSTARDLFCTISNGRFFDIQNGRTKATCKFIVDGPQSTSTESVQEISSRSWNENPMGVALTIDAPEPPVPQEPRPVQEGRCPSNPIWTTRFSGSKESWYPVRNVLLSSYEFRQGPNDTNPNILGATAILNALADGLSPEEIRTESARQGFPLNQNAIELLSRLPRTTSDNQNKSWGKFMNRYAISPVKPLDIRGSDGSGVTWTNSWDIDIPYDGFYGVQGTSYDRGSVLIDGNKVTDLDNFNRDNPKTEKVFIAKGRHKIGIELNNRPEQTFEQINQLIFRTKDWQVGAPPSTNTVDVNFNYRTVASSTLSSSFRIPELGIDIFKPTRTGLNQNIPKKVEVGKVYTIEFEVPNTSGSVSINAKGNTLVVEDLKSSSDRDLFLTVSNGRFFDAVNGRTKATCKFIVDGPSSNVTSSGELKSGTKRNGVTYEGPTLVAYKDNRWGQFMNNQSVSPLIPGEPPNANGRKRFIWKGVRFPESGQYDIRFLADSDARLIIDGKFVLRAQGFAENPQDFKVNVSKGTYDIVVNSEYPYGSPETNTKEYFTKENPTGFALVIRKNVIVGGSTGKSWVQNPIAISAILIPPPCPRRIRGRGVVTDVIVNDPGNGYLRPIPQEQGYPVALRLKEVIVENPGINYNCGVDELQITPSNGAELDYICDPFGKIREVKVLNPGLGFTEYPEIRLISETGVNASFRPVFEVVRDPIVLPERLIQVTDLVGLKQTGYVDGRAYYGSVYYDQGVRYAGFYETVGEPVRVYDTLQESITAQVTTPASAIERQGTDITSNDPRLNIPGTPENLI